MSKTKKETPAIRTDTVSDEAKELILRLRFLDYVARSKFATKENDDFLRNVLQQFEAEVNNFTRPIREQLDAVPDHKAETPH